MLYVFGSPAIKLGLLSISLNWAYFQDRSIWQIQTPKIAPLHFWLLYEVRNIQILTQQQQALKGVPPHPKLTKLGRVQQPPSFFFCSLLDHLEQTTNISQVFPRFKSHKSLGSSFPVELLSLIGKRLGCKRLAS